MSTWNAPWRRNREEVPSESPKPTEEVVDTPSIEEPPTNESETTNTPEIATPTEIALSGQVAVEVQIKNPEPDPELDDTVQNNSDENIFSTYRQQESGLDEQRVFRMRCYDNVARRRNTVADVRRVFGARLNLGPKHAPWVAGERANDLYEPNAGEEVVWKEDSKNRGLTQRGANLIRWITVTTRR